MTLSHDCIFGYVRLTVAMHLIIFVGTLEIPEGSLPSQRPRIYFRHFTDERIRIQIINTCILLGHYGNSKTLFIHTTLVAVVTLPGYQMLIETIVLLYRDWRII